MKLPVNETGMNNTGDPSEPEETGNQSSGEAVSGSATQRPATNGTTAENDFSEFLWMEHEDDFDREVLSELQEEETMNYYCDLFEEAQANGPLRGGSIAMTDPPHLQHVDSLSNRFSNVSLNFRLNPEAPEFVPRFGSLTQSSVDGASLAEKPEEKLNGTDSQESKAEPSS